MCVCWMLISCCVFCNVVMCRMMCIVRCVVLLCLLVSRVWLKVFSCGLVLVVSVLVGWVFSGGGVLWWSFRCLLVRCV